MLQRLTAYLQINSGLVNPTQMKTCSVVAKNLKYQIGIPRQINPPEHERAFYAFWVRN